jgi:hypothetical protein
LLSDAERRKPLDRHQAPPNRAPRPVALLIGKDPEQVIVGPARLRYQVRGVHP